MYEKLKAPFSPELFKILYDFITALLDRHAQISEQSYTAGFKIALRLAMETFAPQTFLIRNNTTGSAEAEPVNYVLNKVI